MQKYFKRRNSYIRKVLAGHRGLPELPAGTATKKVS